MKMCTSNKSNILYCPPLEMTAICIIVINSKETWAYGTSSASVNYVLCAQLFVGVEHDKIINLYLEPSSVKNITL